ncbi:zf-HC2 domain-containing protein [Amycolatopsis sp. CA-126428]|nr:zf-HC2 domain-containing protein [Amycolatopsis sp. CA-126428]
MTTADLHTLTGAYAVNALSDLERAQFDRHLNECDACRLEVRELQ